MSNPTETFSAATARDAYARNMAHGRADVCFAIEQAWGLDGLPPEAVSTILTALADGMTFDAAFEQWSASL